MRRNNTSRLVLTRAIGDRILVGALCLVFGLFISLICFAVHQFQPISTTERVAQHMAFEAFFTLAIFSFLGLIWAACAPRWLERCLQSAYKKVLLTIGVLAVGAVFTVTYFTFIR